MLSINSRMICLCILIAIPGSISAQEKKLERNFLGEEMKFGREAAQFGLWNEAIFRWEKILADKPESAQIHNNLAIAYEYLGDYDRARDLYKTALDLDEDSRDIKRNYKRFLSFYKRHQRQLERERRHREAKARMARSQKQNEQTNDDQNRPDPQGTPQSEREEHRR